MELTDSLKALFVHTAQSLQGSARRLSWHERSKNWDQAAKGKRNANWVGTVGHSAKAGMNCKAVFGALMPLRPVGASVRNTTCRACSPISPPSSIARAKPTHSFVQRACIPV